MPAKPSWIRVKAPISRQYQETLSIIRQSKLNTVCEEAACPNIGECWSKKHATVLVLGRICTRSCRFCNVKTGRPAPLDPNEPEKVAQTVQALGLNHVVVTSVDRDDLLDGGAHHLSQTILAIRQSSPQTTIEILTPDFRNKEGALEIVVAAKPDVFNHNLETIPRLYSIVRPGARYFHSLNLLARVKTIDPDIFTKSGLMVGLGEEALEVYQVMDDMRSAQIDFITLGQYLQPTPTHYPVARYVEPKEFDYYAQMARGKGFLMVSASPLTRSSYHAGEDFKMLQKVRREMNARSY